MSKGTTTKVFISHNEYCTSALTVSSKTGIKIYIAAEEILSSPTLSKFYGVVDYCEITIQEMEELKKISYTRGAEDSSLIKNNLQ